MLSISACIATYERAELLKSTLEGLATQTRLPDEIVVSDASRSSETEEVVRAFVTANPLLNIIYTKTDRKALPWQRWWAFQHASGDIVFFIDDDVMLAPEAIEQLVDVYETDPRQDIAGIGLFVVVESQTSDKRDRRRLREWWLQTHSFPDGSVSPGGMTISLPSVNIGQDSTAAVQWLSGRAMSFRRHVLEKVGALENLYGLYDAGFGKGEDGVLSCYAGRYGGLLLITKPLAKHPADERAKRTAYATEGYLLGLRETWGRAHIFRWMSSDSMALRITWARFAVLELARAARDIVSKPYRAVRWLRLVGILVGILRTILFWRRIPLSA